MKKNNKSMDFLLEVLALWKIESLEIPDNLKKAEACADEKELRSAGRAVVKGDSNGLAAFIDLYGGHIVDCKRCRWIFFDAQAEEFAIQQAASFEKKMNHQVDSAGVQEAVLGSNIQLELDLIKQRLKVILGGALTPISSPGLLLANAGEKSKKRVKKGWRLKQNKQVSQIRPQQLLGEIFLMIEGNRKFLRFQEFPVGTKFYIGNNIAITMRAVFEKIEIPFVDKISLRIFRP